jgi:hypothetical protein
MKIKHTFKGSCGSNYGYYAYIDGDTNKLVIGENWPHEGGDTFRGSFANATRALRNIEKEAPRLYNDIMKYYTEHVEPKQTIRIKDLKFGNEFILNNKKYMLIDMNISSCFVSTAGKESSIACALDMTDFKVYCFDKETEIKILEA